MGTSFVAGQCENSFAPSELYWGCRLDMIALPCMTMLCALVMSVLMLMHLCSCTVSAVWFIDTALLPALWCIMWGY